MKWSKYGVLCLVLMDLVLCFLVLSCLVSSLLILSCVFVLTVLYCLLSPLFICSCPVLSCPILSCPALSVLSLYCLVLYCLVFSFLSYRVWSSFACPVFRLSRFQMFNSLNGYITYHSSSAQNVIRPWPMIILRQNQQSWIQNLGSS